jgi:hypothetical protein
MAEQKTPEIDRAVGKTEQTTAEELPPPFPTPKDKPFNQKHVFMSPTDAMTSPCTEKLINLHRYPRRQTKQTQISSLTGSSRPMSKLASNKENVKEHVPITESTESQ